MSKKTAWIFVDCEARGTSPVHGVLTEFGAVHYDTRDTFHGRLFDATPDPDNPAISIVGERIASDIEIEVAESFAAWLQEHLGKRRPVFVSDNPAYYGSRHLLYDQRVQGDFVVSFEPGALVEPS